MVRLVTVGVGAMNSPRYAPAGLLVAHGGMRVMVDGGPGAEPGGRLDAWLLTDARAELGARIRALARGRGLMAGVAEFHSPGLRIEPRPVVHTSHPTFGYEIVAAGRRVVWAPEFWAFPSWARGADLLFADAAGWSRPIRFRGGVGGHLDVQQVAAEARRLGVRRLVFAHIGRPTIRALDRGERPPFGEVARDGQVFHLTGRRRDVAGDPGWAGRSSLPADPDPV
jgi:beta-lactamase family protein